MPAASRARAIKPLPDAIDSEENELLSMFFPKQRELFFDQINAQKAELEAFVCQLLCVKTCRITPSECAYRWAEMSIYASHFHIASESAPFRAMQKEKIRTETATYVWLQEHCPDVPIPTLHAFGLPDGSTFTCPDNTLWWRKVWWRLNSILAHLLGRPSPIRHVRQTVRHNLTSGFLLISEAQGRPLSFTWDNYCHDQSHRENLFRGLARIALSMNAVPQPRLGSFSLLPDGTVALSNRPLNLHIHMAENEGIHSGILRQRTYTEVDSYLSDLLSLQDRKLQQQPNSIFDVEDGQRQMAASAGMRAVMHHFISPASRQGPFYLTLSDLHRSNIFVDEEWNIKTIIDLEWAYTLPAEMQAPPYWLTSRPVDGFYDATDRREYEEAYNEYLDVYEEEEIRRNGSTRQTTIQRQSWQNGSFWYYHAAAVPKAKYNLFNWHIQPLFNEDHPDESIFDKVFHCYWGRDASTVIDGKVEERRAYVAELTDAHRVLEEEDG